MPLFDFKCLGCGEQFEALVLRQLDPPKCPKCSGEKLEQLFSSAFSVDSENTREHNLVGQRAKHKKARVDYEVAQREYEKHHHH